MFKSGVKLLPVVILCLVPSIAAANLIQNGDFENNTSGVGNNTLYGSLPSSGISPWVYFPAVYYTNPGGTSFDDGAVQRTDDHVTGLDVSPSPDGSTMWGDLRGYDSVYQQFDTVSSNASQSYNISFYQTSQSNSTPAGITVSLWAGDPGSGGTELSSQSFSATAAGGTDPQVVLDSTTLATGTNQSGQSLYLELTENGPSNADNVLFDGVTVTAAPVPEPASLGMLGIMSALLLRRRVHA